MEATTEAAIEATIKAAGGSRRRQGHLSVFLRQVLLLPFFGPKIIGCLHGLAAVPGWIEAGKTLFVLTYLAHSSGCNGFDGPRMVTNVLVPPIGSRSAGSGVR